MSKKVSLGVAASVALIAMAVTFSITMTVSMNMFNNTVSSVKNKERMYNKLSEVDRYVRANEYFDINEDTLNDTIASGYMLGINDKYARYYSAKAYNERMGLADGRLMGIGVAVVKDSSSGYARIIRVYNNTPAFQSALVGEEGSTVTIRYLTPDRQEQSFELTRANYTTPSISAVTMLNGNVGYLRMDSFTSTTAVEFRNAVDNLLNQGAAAMIFDLRDNTGENLNAALVAADYCVPSGLIAQSQAKDGTLTDLRVSDDHEVSVPMVCLVNGSTAGGAELFANALRKMGDATVVGTTTAGKGVLLSDPQSLSDGSAVVITVGMLLDNEGQTWNGTGLTPDVDAALSTDEQSSYYDFTPDNDPQINKALTALSGTVSQP